MISVAEARDRICRHAAPLTVETVPLDRAHGRVLREPVAAAPNGSYNRYQGIRGSLHLPIHQQVVVLRIIPNFLRGLFEPALNHRFGVLRPGPQALFQHLAARRKNKYRYRFGYSPF